MFKDSNILLFLMCIIPIVFYSFTIFFNSPSFSIRLKTSFIYLYTGLLSVTLLQFIHFIFPHIDDTFFTKYIGNFNLNDNSFTIYQPTLATLLTYAFIQVAFMEELSKWIAFKCADYVRGHRKKNLDYPYAIMFYSSLIAAAFSIMENIQYAQRTIHGEFGNITAENLLTGRAVTSVIIHMACGLFMGYYIALAKGATLIKKILYNIIGISAASFMHGIYDFNLMKPGANKDYINLFGNFSINVSSVIVILFCLCIAFFMSYHLKHRDNKEIKQL